MEEQQITVQITPPFAKRGIAVTAIRLPPGPVACGTAGIGYCHVRWLGNTIQLLRDAASQSALRASCVLSDLEAEAPRVQDILALTLRQASTNGVCVITFLFLLFPLSSSVSLFSLICSTSSISQASFSN